jgi:hypothetical protein
MSSPAGLEFCQLITNSHPMTKVLLAAILLLSLSCPVLAQTNTGCRAACGEFGDEQSCRRCINQELWKQGSPGAKLPQDYGAPKGNVFESWQNQQEQQQLERSQRDYRLNCIDSGEC